MHPTTPPSTHATKRGLAAWTTRDLLVTLAISIAIGIVYMPLNNVYTAVNAVNPVAGWAMSGLFALPFFFIGYIIRRPGAAMLYALISGLAWATVSPYGLFGLVASVISGLMAEATQWVATRYTNYANRPMMIWAVLYASFGILVAGIVFRGLLIAPELAIPAALLSIVGYIVANLIAPRLADLVARTGVLSSTALGRERLQEV
jgi:energy-coupling factor transport system substrate-specific component